MSLLGQAMPESGHGKGVIFCIRLGSFSIYNLGLFIDFTIIIKIIWMYFIECLCPSAGSFRVFCRGQETGTKAIPQSFFIAVCRL